MQLCIKNFINIKKTYFSFFRLLPSISIVADNLSAAIERSITRFGRSASIDGN